MANQNVSKVKINDVYYNLKDQEARDLIASIQSSVTNGMHFLGELSYYGTQAIVSYGNTKFNWGLSFINNTYLIGDLWQGVIAIRLDSTKENIALFCSKDFYNDIKDLTDFTDSSVTYQVKSVQIFDSGDFFISHLEGASTAESMEYVYSDFDDRIHALGPAGKQYEYKPEGTVILTKSKKTLSHNVTGSYTPTGTISNNFSSVITGTTSDTLSTGSVLTDVNTIQKAINKTNVLTDVSVTSQFVKAVSPKNLDLTYIDSVTADDTVSSHQASYDSTLECLVMTPVTSINTINAHKTTTSVTNDITYTATDIELTKTTIPAVTSIKNAGDTEEAKEVATGFDKSTGNFVKGLTNGGTTVLVSSTKENTPTSTFTGKEVKASDVITINNHEIETVDSATFDGKLKDVTIKQ
jgi:hypothetical protein